jgi:hypothetical protein
VTAAVGAEALEATEAQVGRSASPFVARLDRGTRAREGKPIELVVRAQHVRFFDPETGRGIYSAD